MTEKLRPTEDIGDLPRIMRAELDHARIALDRAARYPLHGVHEARKRLKKIRTSARLLRKADKTASRRINAAGRRAARILETARDADSLEQITRAVAMTCEDAEHIAVLREEARRARQDSQRVDRPVAVDQARAALDRLQEEIDAFRFEGEPGPALAKGLARTWRRAVRARDAARDNPDGFRLHTLRKRVKDWRYQVVALKRVWPGGVKRRKKKAKRLAKRLGERHDLSRLIARLDDRAGPDLAATIDAIDTRREALAGEVFDLADRVFPSSAKAAKKRLKAAV